MYNLDCIPDNYIGIRGACDDSPTSGLYINDLPGISFKLISKLATEETQRASNLIIDLQKQAIIQVWNDIKSYLSDEIQVNKVISEKQYGRHRFDITPAYLAPTGANVGLIIESDDCDDLTAVRIDYIDVRSNIAALGQVLTITDGCTTKTYTFDALDCQPVRIRTLYTSNTGRIFVTVDDTLLALEDSSINSSCGCSSNCRTSCDECSGSDCGVTVNGWDGTSKTAQAFGMVAKVSCICSPSEFVCQIQDDIALAVQVKLGVLIAYDLKTTKRCNFMVKNGEKDANNILMMLLGGESDGVEHAGEYPIALEQAAKGVERNLLSKHSVCISCGGVRAVETLP